MDALTVAAVRGRCRLFSPHYRPPIPHSTLSHRSHPSINLKIPLYIWYKCQQCGEGADERDYLSLFSMFLSSSWAVWGRPVNNQFDQFVAFGTLRINTIPFHHFSSWGCCRGFVSTSSSNLNYIQYSNIQYPSTNFNPF